MASPAPRYSTYNLHVVLHVQIYSKCYSQVGIKMKQTKVIRAQAADYLHHEQNHKDYNPREAINLERPSTKCLCTFSTALVYTHKSERYLLILMR